MTSGRPRSKEEDEWLAEWYAAMEEYERAFGKPITRTALYSWASSRGIARPRNQVSWLAHPEYDDYLREIIPGHSEAEISELFAERFGIILNGAQIGNRKAVLGVKSGTVGGQFKKGNRPISKGKTWAEMGITPEMMERMRANQYKEGNIPSNGLRLPVGSERVNVDGYFEVKVRQTSLDPRTHKCWQLKHRVVWEEANGRPLSKDEIVIFCDGDRSNLDPSNLMAITKRENAVMNSLGLKHSDRETTETAVHIARLNLAIGEREKGERECPVCGKRFRPEYRNQRRCRACIDAMGANSRKYKAK